MIWPLLLSGKWITRLETQGRWLRRKVKEGTCSKGDAGGEAETLTGPRDSGDSLRSREPLAHPVLTEWYLAWGDSVFMG